MKGNLRLLILPVSGGFKLLCQYRNEEVFWGTFKTIPEVAKRIAIAMKNLEKETK